MKFIRSLIVNILRSFKESYTSRIVVFLSDLAISYLSSVFCFFCIFFFVGGIEEKRAVSFLVYSGTAFFASVFFSLLLGLYRGIIRHSTFQEVTKVFYFSITKGLTMFVAGWVIFDAPLGLFIAFLDTLSTLFYPTSFSHLCSLYLSYAKQIQSHSWKSSDCRDGQQ